MSGAALRQLNRVSADAAGSSFLPPGAGHASHPGFISAEERAAQAEVRVEKRKQPRYLLTRPIFVVPVQPGGAPHLEGILEGVSIDICRSGISVLTAGPRIDSNDLVIGLETDDGSMCFASARIRHSRMTESGLVFGAQFVEAHQDWLRPANLTLRLDPTTYQFKATLRSEHLHLWAMAGVLRPRLVDWVQLCPKCEGLPTFRYGCPGCGSAHIATSQLMHHFACAHVAPVVEFDQSDSIVCPKCRAKNLVVGTDFEYLTGVYRCLDCGWSDSDLMQIAQCLNCQFRFPAAEAIERELIEFYVNRLDPLALVAGG
jgi:hypothetical protein